MDLIIRKCGNICDVTPDGQSPTPLQIKELLIPHLQYQHTKLLYGHARWHTGHGQERRAESELRKLYSDQQGRFTFPSGFVPKVQGLLKRCGVESRLVDLGGNRKRPDCYKPYWDHVRNYLTFRARQEECLQLVADKQGGVINAPAGFGKTTLTAATALLFPHARIHIIIKLVDVAKRFVNDLTRIISDVGQVGAGERRWGRVTVITADSLHLSDGDADFVFGDECHTLMTDRYASQLMELYRDSRNFGLSASPYGRMDGASFRLEAFFGPQIFLMTYQEAVKLGLVVPIFVRWLHMPPETFNPAADKTGVPKKRHGLWRNQDRNKLFADALREYPNEQCLALVETLEHALHLWQFLPEYELCYASMTGEQMAKFRNQRLLPDNFIPVNDIVREQKRQAFSAGTLRKAIATDVWATGVDFPECSVLARLDGRDSEIRDTQGPGRASRIFTDEQGVSKEYAVVLDCNDSNDKTFRNKALSRRRTYRNFGWSQTDDDPTYYGRKQRVIWPKE